MAKWNLSLKNKFGLSFEASSISVIHHINNKCYKITVITTDTEKTFDKIEHPSMTKQNKTSQYTRNVENFLNLIKVIYKIIKL